jgi:hypothetical protein
MFQETKELTITSAPKVGKWHDLAEAIRQGCARFPYQAYHSYYDSMAACAMGAAAAILRMEPLDIDCPEVRVCPVRSNCELLDTVIPRNHLFSLVVHLNDDHRWSRERIADYLDTL